MFSKNAPMSTAAKNVAAHLAKALKPAQQVKPLSDPTTQLVATTPRPSSLPTAPSRVAELLAAFAATTNTRNNANMKGKK
jgi:hypothetical protein